MLIILIIVFAIRLIYSFDVNFVSGQKNARLIINGEVNIECWEDEIYSISLDMATKNPSREQTEDGYWWYKFEFEDTEVNIKGSSYIRIRDFKGYLSDLQIGMTIRSKETLEFENYKFLCDLYTQRFPINSPFICNSRRIFDIKVIYNELYKCLGELDISSFKFVMDENTLTNETLCVPDTTNSNNQPIYSSDSSSIHPETTVLSIQTGNLISDIENQSLAAITSKNTQESPEYTPANTEPRDENFLTLTQTPAGNPLTLTQPLADNPLTITQPPADNPLTLTQPSADNPLTLTQPPADNPLTFTQPQVDNPHTLTQPRPEMVPKKTQSPPLVTPIKTQSTSEDTPKNTQTPHANMPKNNHPRDTTINSKIDSNKAYLDASASHNKKQSLIIGMTLFSGVVLGITVYLIFRFYKK